MVDIEDSEGCIAVDRAAMTITVDVRLVLSFEEKHTALAQYFEARAAIDGLEAATTNRTAMDSQTLPIPAQIAAYLGRTVNSSN